MSPLHLFSEPYRSSGNIDARAARRAIGRPSLDPWGLFLRETLQNSWDARISPRGPIDFRVDTWWATKKQLAVLRNELFASEPEGLPLDVVLAEQEIPLLVITDTSTRGLGGPTRADLVTEERSDFIDFVRNIGRATDKTLGGGTYGFGKGVLYDASACSTTIVFTRTDHAGGPVNRLMAMALGDSFSGRGKRYTGRHWWGVEDDLTGAEPVTGRQAEVIAETLNLSHIPRGQTGTSIMVVAPVAHDGETLDEIVHRIAEAATLWAWPHMLGDVEEPSIRFSFTHEGEEIQPPDPRQQSRLRHFAEAYHRAESVLAGEAEPQESWPWTTVEIRSERPARRLGVVAYRRYRRETSGVAGDGEPDLTSHIALMRDPRLVVKYLSVTPDPGGLATPGVFLVDPELNDEFAMSEPVAHDDWVPENLRLEKYERNPVKQALERLRNEFKRSARTQALADGGTRFAGMTRLSTFMGDLLEGQPGGTDVGTRGPTLGVDGGGTPAGGEGAERSGGRRRRPTRRGAVSVSTGARPRLLVDHGQPAVEFEIWVQADSEAPTTKLTAVPRVVVDGGAPEASDEVPVGAEEPEILGWRAIDSDRLERGDSIVVDGGESRAYAIRVRQPYDTAVTVSIKHSTLARPV